MSFECIWCGQRIDIDHGRWAYIHSVALLHFTSCAERPLEMTRGAIEEMAAQVADKIEEMNQPK